MIDNENAKKSQLTFKKIDNVNKYNYSACKTITKCFISASLRDVSARTK